MVFSHVAMCCDKVYCLSMNRMAKMKDKILANEWPTKWKWKWREKNGKKWRIVFCRDVCACVGHILPRIPSSHLRVCVGCLCTLCNLPCTHNVSIEKWNGKKNGGNDAYKEPTILPNEWRLTSTSVYLELECVDVTPRTEHWTCGVRGVAFSRLFQTNRYRMHFIQHLTSASAQFQMYWHGVCLKSFHIFVIPVHCNEKKNIHFEEMVIVLIERSRKEKKIEKTQEEMTKISSNSWHDSVWQPMRYQFRNSVSLNFVLENENGRLWRFIDFLRFLESFPGRPECNQCNGVV